ncbi:MAG TPA: trehalose-phosphatase [Thermomicrobiales bacterium]|nr:trehalose-phosphatase [Thermomicrobiales bacterium]
MHTPKFDPRAHGPSRAVEASVAVAGVADFWRRVDSASHIVLMLDYDGTLAPFHVDRMQARPLPNVLDALEIIDDDDRTTVAIVSGRPVEEVQTLLGNPRFRIAGSHGYEMYDPAGEPFTAPITSRQSTVLDEAVARAISIFDPARVERKAASVAVHFRGLEPRHYRDVEDALRSEWRAVSPADSMEIRPFNGGIELRATGRTKGSVVREILAESPVDALAIYIGDDDTDEDAFAALPDTGIGVKVSLTGAESLARGRLPDCAAVERLLIDWGMRRKRS